ncbi:MAG: class I SAM-dependent methyltransferase [Gammaproteobacteria bacterium]|nr:class I SAM-dependent methyltransferase [Gammaproteobacteria bacterium]
MSSIEHWTRMGRHELVPEVKHDEAARLTVIAHLNAFLSGRVAPAVKSHYENKVRPEFVSSRGHEPADRQDVAEAMEADPFYQVWSTLRRNTMEMRQQAGRGIVLRQAAELADKARTLNSNAATLRLNPELRLPEYVAHGDQHLMPGGYAGELLNGDVSGPANYDIGLFATMRGMAGPWNDLAGHTLVSWLQKSHPDFKPKRILDLGCGLGHNTLPLREAFPEAEIVAIDVAAPMLRYGHARAQSLGVKDVHFIQADATATGLEADGFDLVFTTMVLHETSAEALSGIFSECHRLVRDGGLVAHLEQPPYRRFEPFEQFMRDWDGRNNNEPFWTSLHELSLPDELINAGFDADAVFEADAVAPGCDQSGGAEDFGRAPKWYVVGAQSVIKSAVN